ncbi:MAG TPA: hypothetical protein VF625_08675 [Longimicrobium sp.]
MTDSFSTPVAQLLTLGEEPARRPEWPDYLALGLTAEHVPELIRLAVDHDLWQSESESDDVWGPLHAYRALGQLRAEDAAEPLTKLLDDNLDNDWVFDEMPMVLGMIGRAAIPHARALLARTGVDETSRWASASTLRFVAQRHPDARDEAIGTLVEALLKWPDEDPTMNAILVWALADLGAVEAAPIMEAAFEADAVDLQIGGDWEDVQVRLGLLPDRIHPRTPVRVFLPPPQPTGVRPPARGNPTPKNQRKAARKARKRNRRK